MILFIADVHIKLGQKKVPVDWQRNRFLSLADELSKVPDVTKIVIGGDLLDTATPSVAEIGLMYEFLKKLPVGGIIIPGNHEMETKTRDCYSSIETMLGDLGWTIVRNFQTIDGIDYIPYNVLKDTWPVTDSKLAITHVRGAIEPHVKPEIDLSLFSRYDKVYAGDLHSYKNTQSNIFYPGSPVTTSFHRQEITGANGYFIVDPRTRSHYWVELKLPQLIRKTVSSESEIIKTDFHHTVYEVAGDLDSLAKVDTSNDLLDRKVATETISKASLELSGCMVEELSTYLQEVMQIEDPSPYITMYKEVIDDAEDN